MGASNPGEAPGQCSCTLLFPFLRLASPLRPTCSVAPAFVLCEVTSFPLVCVFQAIGMKNLNAKEKRCDYRATVLASAEG